MKLCDFLSAFYSENKKLCGLKKHAEKQSIPKFILGTAVSKKAENALSFTPDAVRKIYNGVNGSEKRH